MESLTVKKKGWSLYNKNGLEVYVKELIDNDGEYWVVEGGDPPHKPSSSGRVWVRLLDNPEWTREFFPHVFDMKWRLDDEHTS